MEISEDDKRLNLKLTNDGTEIVSTLQIKLSYFDMENRLRWVEPFYLQNNLIPGETRRITVPLSTLPRPSQLAPETVIINGQPQPSAVTKSSLERIGVRRPNGAGQILIDYDAMIYRPLD